MRGRNPQSEAEKNAKGNPGRRSRKMANAPVPEAPDIRSTAPSHLSKAAKQIWDKLVPDLKNLNFIRDTDQMAFIRYCEHAAKWGELTLILQKKGFYYTSESNHGTLERLHPAFLIRERTERQLLSLEDRFGLNPVYRQQILQRMAGALPPPPPGDLFNSQNNDQSAEPAEAQPPSAVGLLKSAGSVH